MNKTPIYTVTTIRSTGFNSRCVGFFHEYENAEKIILENIYDIYEDYYLYAVIEKIEAGIYSQCKESTWFIWENDSYKKLDKKPERFNNVINFSIG